MKKVEVRASLESSLESLDELNSCVDVKDLNLYYSKDKQALIDVNLKIPEQRVTAFIGPS